MAAEGDNGQGPKDPEVLKADEPTEAVTISVTYDPATGKIGIHGVTDRDVLVASHILRDASDAVRARVRMPHLNAALGVPVLGGRRIVVPRGGLGPFDDRGIRGGGR